jgi:uncharacterized integral membrane protein
MEGTPASSGRGVRFWVMIVAIVLGLVFIAVNFQKVTIDFVIAETKAPLVLALVISGLLGFIVGLALPRFRRRD